MVPINFLKKVVNPIHLAITVLPVHNANFKNFQRVAMSRSITCQVFI